MPGRFTVAANAIIEKDGKVLITKRTRGRWLGDYWEFISGRLEQGEDFITGLKREVKEEVNLEIEPYFPLNTSHFYHGKKNPKNEVIMVTYLCRYLLGEVILRKEEQSEYKWIDPQELLHINAFCENLKDDVQKYLKYVRHKEQKK